jgi:hypothetical protein
MLHVIKDAMVLSWGSWNLAYDGLKWFIRKILQQIVT